MLVARHHASASSRLGLRVFACLALALLCTLPLAGQERGDDSGRASKNGLTQGTIGDTEITITFGRPKVKGRTIWGALVPYNAVWRAGADEATTITFSQDVEIEGQPVPAGTYSLFFLPQEDEWTLILNKVAKQWGAFRYDEAQDQLRVEVDPEPAEHVEELDYEIEGDQVVLRWDKLAVPFTISS